jgi:hypothetical protein
MGVFVHVDCGDRPGGDCVARTRFAGQLVTRRIAPVADYQLIGRSAKEVRDGVISEHERYSRWTEPGLCLFARLLERSAKNFLSEPLDTPVMTVTLSVGREALQSTAVETLVVQRKDDECLAVLSTNVRKDLVWIDAVSADQSLRSALLQVFAWVFRWHPRMPPVPAPLTSVPIQKSAAGPVVALGDIPQHARAHFVQQLGLTHWPAVVPAFLWLYWIGVDVNLEALRSHQATKAA